MTNKGDKKKKQLDINELAAKITKEATKEKPKTTDKSPQGQKK